MGKYWITMKDCDVKENNGIGHGAYAKTIDGVIACARHLMGEYGIPYHRLSVFDMEAGERGDGMEELGTVEELVFDRHELRKLLKSHNKSSVQPKKRGKTR